METYSVIAGVMLVVNLIGLSIGTTRYPSGVMPPPRDSRKSGESISTCNSLSINSVSAIHLRRQKINRIARCTNFSNKPATYSSLLSIALDPSVSEGRHPQKASPQAHPS